MEFDQLDYSFGMDVPKKVNCLQMRGAAHRTLSPLEDCHVTTVSVLCPCSNPPYSCLVHLFMMDLKGLASALWLFYFVAIALSGNQSTSFCRDLFTMRSFFR